MKRFNRILVDQRQELKEKLGEGDIIEREMLPYAGSLVSSKLVKVITGVRRCGKSVFSTQLLGGESYGYVNFDDERLSEVKADELNEILEAVYGISGEMKLLLLDEVQNVDKWELFVNRLQRKGINLIVTGSNAKLLSSELATHLTGRHVVFELFPFSFREFLRYKNIGSDAETTKERGIIKHSLQEYINNGGFPETLEENPKAYLKSLYSAILFKDILVRHKIRQTGTFRDLSMYVISNFSNEMSFNRLKNIFNLGSDHTAKNYLGYLEEAYIVFPVEKFSYKKKESLTGNRKVYVVDTGLINALSFKFSKNMGGIYENIVAIELLRKRETGDIEIYYWKDHSGKEIDFVIKKGLRIKQLIQVCYDVDEYETKKRETRALLKASRELKCKNLLVITEDYEAEEKIKGETIKFLPLWKWLLGNL